eukprot:scaffold28643_cov19-Tisochrysis_lutea.AAC.2
MVQGVYKWYGQKDEGSAALIVLVLQLREGRRHRVLAYGPTNVLCPAQQVPEERKNQIRRKCRSGGHTFKAQSSANRRNDTALPCICYMPRHTQKIKHAF